VTELADIAIAHAHLAIIDWGTNVWLFEHTVELSMDESLIIEVMTV
jgi:hypothetical protein